MPFYEYQCRRCSHPFEELVYGDESPACPKCHAAEVEKVLSVFAVGKGGSVASPCAGGPCASEGAGMGMGGCGGGGCDGRGGCGLN